MAFGCWLCCTAQGAHAVSMYSGVCGAHTVESMFVCWVLLLMCVWLYSGRCCSSLLPMARYPLNTGVLFWKASQYGHDGARASPGLRAITLSYSNEHVQVLHT